MRLNPWIALAISVCLLAAAAFADTTVSGPITFVSPGLSVSGSRVSATAGTGGITQLTGDVTAGPGSGSQAATLVASGVTAGTYTLATVTVDAKGRTTSASSGTLPTATPSTPGIAKLHYVPVAVGWIAGNNPNGATVAIVNQASTISALIGDVETPVGTAATVSVYIAPSGTPCASGTLLHSGSLDANGAAATNQTLTLTTTSIPAGDRICLQTTGTTDWTSGAGVGGITIYLAPS